MSEVIEVDFRKKKKIEKYISKKWLCSTCNSVNIYDSRNENNMQYIQFQNRACVCEDCAKAIYETVKEEGWIE